MGEFEGKEVSTIDLSRGGFVLLTGRENENWKKEVDGLELGVKVRVISVGMNG